MRLVGGRIRQSPAIDCVYRGKQIGFAHCPSCRGSVRLKVFECDVHGACTVGRSVPGIRCCSECDDYAYAAGSRALYRRERRVGAMYVWPRPSRCDVLLVMPHSAGDHWIHRYAPAARAALRAAGLSVVAVHGPNRLPALEPVLALCQPRVVFNHAAMLGTDSVKALSDRGLRVVTLVHSCLADLARMQSLVSRLPEYERYSVVATPSHRIAKLTGWVHIPNPVPLLRERQRHRQADQLNVGILCRPAVVKNIVPQALAACRAGHKVVLLSGCDHIASWLRHAGADVKVAPRMPWFRLMRWIRGLDVVMMVSHEESFGYVAVESALQGVPVIVSTAMGWGPFQCEPHADEQMVRLLGLIAARYDEAARACLQAARALAARQNAGFARAVSQLARTAS